MLSNKDIIVNILIPFTVFMVVSALVLDLLMANMIKPKTNDTPPLLTEMSYDGSRLQLDYGPIYQGGMAIDRVVAQSGEALRITADKADEWFGATAPLPIGMQSVGAISMTIRVEDWQQVDRLLIGFLSNDGQDGYFGINLTNYFARPGNNEWRKVVLDRSAFSVLEGEPEWGSVTDMVIRVVPKTDTKTRVWVDDVRFYEVVDDRSAIVTFTFDDGFASVVDANTILSQFGMRGTAYVIPEFLGKDGYLTQSNVDSLASAGWDIGGHGSKNLVELSTVEVRDELVRMHTYLQEHGFQGGEHFAYPNGGYNPAVQSLVLERFTSARTIDGFSQSPEKILPESVNAITISSSTPVTEIIAEIDKAVKNGTWLILVWHDLSPSPQLSYEYRRDDFAWIVRYLASKEVAVLPYSEAYAKLQQP